MPSGPDYTGRPRRCRMSGEHVEIRMAEALTESFCERCGTRYEFTAPTRLNPLRRTRGLVTGLKNYIMSQEALSDSVGDAIRSEEEELGVAHLEAFHAAFNFCIDCRQYTCTNCWNNAAGRCRSCAPVVGTDDLLERFEASFAAGHQPPEGTAPLAELEGSEIGQRLGIDAWPSSDLPRAETNGHAPSEPGWPAEPEPESEPIAAFEPEPEPIAAFEPGFAPAAPETEPIAAFEPGFAPAAPETEPITAFEPGFAPAAPEPEPVAAFEPGFAPAAPETEPITAFEPGFAPAAPPQLTVVTWDDDGSFDLLPEPRREPEPEPATWVADEAQDAVTVPEPEEWVAATVEPTLVRAFGPQPLVPEEMAEPSAAQAEEPLVPEEMAEPLAAQAEEPLVEPVATAPEESIEAPLMAAMAAPTEEQAAPEPGEPLQRTIRPIGDTILHLPNVSPSPPARPAAPSLPLAAENPLAATRRTQLDLLGLDDPGQGTVQPARPQVIPYRSSGAAASPIHARAQAPNAFWDASAREVAGAMSTIGVQSCAACGLSLSASARFCRRCGTRQAQPA